MGDPKKQRKKFERPKSPWNKENLDFERALKKDYGLKNKKEIWKLQSKLRRFRRQAKHLIVSNSLQAQKEEKQLFAELYNLGLLETIDTKIENVLDLDMKKLLERRLQTQVCKKGLAKSVSQARQFIVHRHITVDGKTITSPSYIVKKDEEDKITFNKNSQLANPEHPERVLKKPVMTVQKNE